MPPKPNNPSMDLQMQIRNNSMEMASFLSDLNDWTNDVEAKDQALKKGQVQMGSEASTAPAPAPPKAAPAPRGRVTNTVKPAVPKPPKAMSKKKAEAKAKEAAAKEKASAAGHTYDYFRDKWDKFDVDAALEDVDKASSDEEEAAPRKKKGAGSEGPAIPRGPGDIAAGQEFEQPEPAEIAFDPEEEKNKGNELYKKGDYGGAVLHYTNSINAKATAIGHANRAMALLKLGQFAEAEADCTAALELDQSYVKGPQYPGLRVGRAMVRWCPRHLKKYLDSVEDFEWAVRYEPSSATHTAERLASQRLLEEAEKLRLSQPRTLLPVTEILPTPEPEPAPTPVAAVSAASSSRPKVTALDGSVSVAAADAVEPPRHPQSVGENASASADEGRATSAAARGDAVAAGAAAAVGDANGGGGEAEEERAAVPLRTREEMEEMALSAAAKLEAKQLERAKAAALTMPKSGLEYERAWKALSKDPTALDEFLKVLDGGKLPVVFKDSLSAPIMAGTAKEALRRAGPSGVLPAAQAAALLEGFARTPRFDMTVLFLGAKDKKELRELWDAAQGAASGADAERLQAVRKHFKL